MASNDSTSDGPASRRVALYCKTKPQLRRLRRHAQEQGWRIDGEYLERRGSTTALERLLSEQQQGKVAVLLPSLDSLGKDARRVLLALDRMRKAGLGFLSLREGIDSEGAAGWTVLELVKATAKLERRKARGRPPDMHRRGLSLRQMARLLKVSKSTVARLVKALPPQRLQSDGLLAVDRPPMQAITAQ